VLYSALPGSLRSNAIAVPPSSLGLSNRLMALEVMLTGSVAAVIEIYSEAFTAIESSLITPGRLTRLRRWSAQDDVKQDRCFWKSIGNNLPQVSQVVHIRYLSFNR